MSRVTGVTGERRDGGEGRLEDVKMRLESQLEEEEEVVREE